MKKALKINKVTKNSASRNQKDAVDYFKAVTAFTLGPAELKHRIDAGENPCIVDVRHSSDFAEAHVPGAMSLPSEKWDTAMGLSKEGVNIFYCYTQQCHMAQKACLYFASKGYAVMHMEGGMDAWTAYGYDVETQPIAEVASQPMQESV